MNLTLSTDYSLRALIYLGTCRPQLASVAQISEAYGISRHHLVKVVHQLGRLGFIETLQGRGGGLRLAREPGSICIGDLVRRTETFQLVECFDRERNTCPITPACTLKHILGEATEAFVSVLDRYTLADLLKHPRKMAQLLMIERV